jgi:hypothetical protein
MCGTTLFLGCPTEAGGGSGGLIIEVPAGQTKYYSLKTGMEITNAASTAWDIAFERETGNTMSGPLIYTNSGNTAAEKGSGGDGGVWYTGTTNFASVTLADRINAAGEYVGFDSDTNKKVKIEYPGGGGGSTVYILSINMNVMTYLGYRGGSGSAGDPYLANLFTNPSTYVPYMFNKNQFYGMNSLTNCYTTNQVYIIRHGDGSRYSKVQITGFEMPAGKDVYRVQSQRLN